MPHTKNCTKEITNGAPVRAVIAPISKICVAQNSAPATTHASPSRISSIAPPAIKYAPPTHAMAAGQMAG